MPNHPSENYLPEEKILSTYFFWYLSQSKELYNIKPPLVKKAHFSSSIPLCQSFPLRLQNCTWNGRILIADFSPDFVSVRLLIWNYLKSDCTIEPYFLFFESFELRDTIISALKFCYFSRFPVKKQDFSLRSFFVHCTVLHPLPKIISSDSTSITKKSKYSLEKLPGNYEIFFFSWNLTRCWFECQLTAKLQF
jgi:hypothetical protein